MPKKCRECDAIMASKSVKTTTDYDYSEGVEVNYCKFCGVELVYVKRWELTSDN